VPRTPPQDNPFSDLEHADRPGRSLNVAVAIALIAIALTAFWARERWAWWTLLVGHTIALGTPRAYDQLHRAQGQEEKFAISGASCVSAAQLNPVYCSYPGTSTWGEKSASKPMRSAVTMTAARTTMASSSRRDGDQ
jgi:hypothetical protein